MVRNMLTPLHKMDEVHYWENRPFSGDMPAPSRSKTEETRKTIKKKPKRIRTAYTTEQIRALELLFTQNKYITPERRREISAALKIGDKSVKIWFQNRRMKEKRESSESSSDSSSENVTDSEASTPTISIVSPDAMLSCGVDSVSSPDSNQFQAPYFYSYNMNEQQNQNAFASEYALNQTTYSSDNNTPVQNNCMQYYTECNVYPTEYYPCNDGNYTNECNNYYFRQQENEMRMYNDCWNSNNESTCYYYN